MSEKWSDMALKYRSEGGLWSIYEGVLKSQIWKISKWVPMSLMIKNVYDSHWTVWNIFIWYLTDFLLGNLEIY